MMPLVNEIRRRLGEAPLEGSAVVTELGATSEAAIERFEGIDGVDKAKKIRAAYQQVLLSILKGEDRARAVQTLKKVAQVNVVSKAMLAHRGDDSGEEDDHERPEENIIFKRFDVITDKNTLNTVRKEMKREFPKRFTNTGSSRLVAVDRS